MLFQVCVMGHVRYRWCSQLRLKARGIPAGDFLLSVNVLLSGNNMSKVSLLMKFMNIGVPTFGLHHGIERLYTCPGVDHLWDQIKEQLQVKLEGKQLVLAGNSIHCYPKAKKNKDNHASSHFFKKLIFNFFVTWSISHPDTVMKKKTVLDFLGT